MLERSDLDALLDFHISRPRPRSGGEGLDRLIRGRPLRDLRWSELTRAGAESTVDGALSLSTCGDTRLDTNDGHLSRATRTCLVKSDWTLSALRRPPCTLGNSAFAVERPRSERGIRDRCRADYTSLAVNPGENKLIEISYLQATRIYAKVDIQRLPHIEPAVAGRRRPGYGELCGDRVVSRLSCRSNWSISDRVAPGPSSGIATYRGQRARP